jgi:hypothetical protein
MLVKKCYMEWKIYRMEHKMKRSQKEIHYYQGKYEEMDVALAQSRNTINQLTKENESLKT